MKVPNWYLTLKEVRSRLMSNQILENVQSFLKMATDDSVAVSDKLIDELDSYAENPDYKSKLKEIIGYLLTQPPQ